MTSSDARTTRGTGRRRISRVLSCAIATSPMELTAKKRLNTCGDWWYASSTMKGSAEM